MTTTPQTLPTTNGRATPRLPSTYGRPWRITFTDETGFHWFDTADAKIGRAHV